MSLIRFLQFGSPHDLSAQAEYIAAQRKEIWVNIGYRLSAFGFLASDMPHLSGNYGFKDQWLGLLWIRDNIAAFGGEIQSFHSFSRLAKRNNRKYEKYSAQWTFRW